MGKGLEAVALNISSEELLFTVLLIMVKNKQPAVVSDLVTSTSGKPKRRILRQIFRSSRGLSTAEAHVFGVKFIRPNGLNGNVGFDCY